MALNVPSNRPTPVQMLYEGGMSNELVGAVLLRHNVRYRNRIITTDAQVEELIQAYNTTHDGTLIHSFPTLFCMDRESLDTYIFVSKISEEGYFLLPIKQKSEGPELLELRPKAPRLSYEKSAAHFAQAIQTTLETPIQNGDIKVKPESSVKDVVTHFEHFGINTDFIKTLSSHYYIKQREPEKFPESLITTKMDAYMQRTGRTLTLIPDYIFVSKIKESTLGINHTYVACLAKADYGQQYLVLLPKQTTPSLSFSFDAMNGVDTYFETIGIKYLLPLVKQNFSYKIVADVELQQHIDALVEEYHPCVGVKDYLFLDEGNKKEYVLVEKILQGVKKVHFIPLKEGTIIEFRSQYVPFYIKPEKLELERPSIEDVAMAFQKRITFFNEHIFEKNSKVNVREVEIHFEEIIKEFSIAPEKTYFLTNALLEFLEDRPSMFYSYLAKAYHGGSQELRPSTYHESLGAKSTAAILATYNMSQDMITEFCASYKFFKRSEEKMSLQSVEDVLERYNQKFEERFFILEKDMYATEIGINGKVFRYVLAYSKEEPDTLVLIPYTITPTNVVKIENRRKKEFYHEMELLLNELKWLVFFRKKNDMQSFNDTIPLPEECKEIIAALYEERGKYFRPLLGYTQKEYNHFIAHASTMHMMGVCTAVAPLRTLFLEHGLDTITTNLIINSARMALYERRMDFAEELHQRFSLISDVLPGSKINEARNTLKNQGTVGKIFEPMMMYLLSESQPSLHNKTDIFASNNKYEQRGVDMFVRKNDREQSAIDLSSSLGKISKKIHQNGYFEQLYLFKLNNSEQYAVSHAQALHGCSNQSSISDRKDIYVELPLWRDIITVLGKNMDLNYLFSYPHISLDTRMKMDYTLDFDLFDMLMETYMKKYHTRGRAEGSEFLTLKRGDTTVSIRRYFPHVTTVHDYIDALYEEMRK